MALSTPSARLSRAQSLLIGRFRAMACPCEILMETQDLAEGHRLLELAEREAQRVEAKFSRYLSGNIIDLINTSKGREIQVDEETAQLLDFAAEAYRMSEGLFDVTSGILRKAWCFDGSDNVPSPNTIAHWLSFVGWDKVSWKRPSLKLCAGMELDLGGIGKEYAVDRITAILQKASAISFLVNCGGDIAIGRPRKNGEPWSVGIERYDIEGQAARMVQIFRGALATSGDARKFVIKDGKRYGHILNPLTGYPTEDTPRSVTVAAGICVQAGFLSTVGMLKGCDAESFLTTVAERFWCFRDMLRTEADADQACGDTGQDGKGAN